MYCSQCGTKLPDNAKFCYKCGAKIEIPEWEEAQQVPAEEAPRQPAIQWPDIPVLSQPVQQAEPVRKDEPEIRWPGMETAPQPVSAAVQMPAQEQEVVLTEEPVTEYSAPYAEAGQVETETAPVFEVQEQAEPEQTAETETFGYTENVAFEEAEKEEPSVYTEPAAETYETATNTEIPETDAAVTEPEIPAEETPEEPVAEYSAPYAEAGQEETEPAPVFGIREQTEPEQTAGTEAFGYTENVTYEEPEKEETPAYSEPAAETYESEPYTEVPETDAVTETEPEYAEESVTEQTEEVFEPFEVPQETQQNEEEYSGFRIVEKAVQLPQGGYVFSHADDLARAASDALSQFDILTDQELLNVEVSAAEAAQTAADVMLPQTDTETVPEEEISETAAHAEVPETETVAETGSEREEPAWQEMPAEETADTVPEETQQYNETEEQHEYAEVTEEEPSAEEGPAYSVPSEDAEAPAESAEETAAEEAAVQETAEEIPAEETLVEDFIPSQLISEELTETEEEARTAPEEESLTGAEADTETALQEPDGTEKQGEAPISFEEFRFYTRREIEEEKAAYEQQKAEEGEPVQEEEDSYFSFEGEQKEEEPSEIPDLMYSQEEVPSEINREEPQPETEEEASEQVIPEETAEEKTVFTQEETAEEPAAEAVSPEETPAEEPVPAEEQEKETSAEEEKEAVPEEKTVKNEKKRSSSHRSKTVDSEDEKKKKENRNRLISLIAALVVLAAAAFAGWYWYNLPNNVYSRYMSGALKAVEQGDVYTAAVDFNEALKVRPESLQASEQLDRLYSETYSLTYEYMDKQMFSEAHDQAKLLDAIHPAEAENNTAILKDVFMEWAAASTRTGNDQDIQHVLDMASSELSRENYTDVENSARAAKAGYEYADFFMNSGERLMELNSGNDRAGVFAQLDSMLSQVKEYAGKSGSFPVRLGTDSQGREAAIYYTSDQLLQLYIGKFDSAGNRTGDAFSYIITTASDGSKEYGSYSASWNSDRPNGNIDYHDFAGNYSGAERMTVRGSAVNGYFDGNVSMLASDGYTYGVSFTSGTVKVLADTAPDGQKNVIGYANDGERWLCWSDDQISRLHGVPYAE